MIFIDLPNTVPQVIDSGLGTKLKGKSIPYIKPSETIDFCFCDIECTYVENVFAEVGGEDYKNDKREFLIRRLIASDTVDFKLFKNGLEIANLDNNTLGTFFNGFPNGNSEQQLYVGFLVEWEKVYGAFGGGEYQVKADLSIIGNISVFESELFNLMGYSDIAADRTVRIETMQNGNIIGSNFDFTGLEWYQSIRIRGIFYEDSESFEKNAYLNQNYEQNQIQDKIIENWILLGDFIPRSVSEFITKNALLSNEVNMTDYSILSEKILRKVSVYPESIEKNRIVDNRTSNYSIKFTSKSENLIKRNY